MKSSRVLPTIPLVALLAACGRPAPAPETPNAQVSGDVVTFRDAPPSETVSAEPVGARKDDVLSVTGRLTWDEDRTVRIFSPVAGRVEKVLADVGQRVAKGQTMASIASPDFGQAQADAARAETDLAAATRTLERVRQLLERGAAPKKDVDQAEADERRARAEADRTRARLALWGGAAATPGHVDQLLPLASPIAGLVVERVINPGQEVRPDAQVPLMVVSDPTRLWITLDVPEKDVALLAPGMPLKIRAAAYPGTLFEGRLEVAGASIDPTTRTVRSRGTVANPRALLRAEMYVTVELHRPVAARQIVVPARAVLKQGDANVVFVEESPNRFRRHRVIVGSEQDGIVPVVSGLADSDRVVTHGNLLLSQLFPEGNGA